MKNLHARVVIASLLALVGEGVLYSELHTLSVPSSLFQTAAVVNATPDFGSYTNTCTPVSITDPKTFDVKAFGAIGDGQPHPLSEKFTTLASAQKVFPSAGTTTEETDDAAIQSAVDAAIKNGGGRIYFPAGTYLISKEERPAGGAIRVTNAKNLLFEGESENSAIIKMKVTSYFSVGDPHMVQVIASSNIIFKNLTLDGSRTTALFHDEQAHGIYLKAAQNVTIQNVHFYHVRGDGIFTISDDPVLWTENLLVQNSSFEDNGRSGGAHQRGTKRVCYVNNTFSLISDQDIDFESTGRSGNVRAAEDIWVVGNTFNHTTGPFSLTPGGHGLADYAKRIYVLNNTIDSGAVFFRTITDAVFANNVVRNTTPELTFEVGNMHNFIVQNNRIETNNSIPVIRMRGEASENVQIIGNLIVQNGTRADAAHYPIGIDADNYVVNDMVISGNTIVGAGVGRGISFTNVVPVQNKNLTITDNTFQNFEKGVLFARASLAAPSQITNVRITGNAFALSTTNQDAVLAVITSTAVPPFLSALTVTGNTSGKGVNTPLTLSTTTDLIAPPVIVPDPVNPSPISAEGDPNEPVVILSSTPSANTNLASTNQIPDGLPPLPVKSQVIVQTPTLLFFSSTSSVASGSTVTLTWTSTKAASCKALSVPQASDWEGEVVTSGSQAVSVSKTTTYYLTCTTAEGGSFADGNVRVGVLGVAQNTPSGACVILSHALYQGVRDKDTEGEVTKVQQFLSQYPTLFPEKIVSGYYGALTKAAMKRFQDAQIPSASQYAGYGGVGAKTRAKIQELTCGAS